MVGEYRWDRSNFSRQKFFMYLSVERFNMKGGKMTISRVNVSDYVRTTVFPSGTRHVELTSDTNPLRYNQGVTDMWCSTNPTTGGKILYLENEKGDLVREFDLSHQKEQARNFFKKVNSERLKALEYLKLFKSYVEVAKKYDNQITQKVLGRDDTVYIVEDKTFERKSDALKELLKDNPDELAILERYQDYVKKPFHPSLKNETRFIEAQVGKIMKT